MKKVMATWLLYGFIGVSLNDHRDYYEVYLRYPVPSPEPGTRMLQTMQASKNLTRVAP